VEEEEAHLTSGISKHFWSLLEQEKKRFQHNGTGEASMNATTGHYTILLAQVSKRLTTTIVEGRKNEARWRDMLAHNLTDELTEWASIEEEWQNSRGHNTSKALYDGAKTALLQEAAGTMLNTHVVGLLQGEKESAALVRACRQKVHRYKTDIVNDNTRVYTHAMDTIEESHVLVVSKLLKELSLVQSTIRHNRHRATQEAHQHALRLQALKTQHRARHRDRSLVRTRHEHDVEQLEMLKGHVLEMWNKLGTSTEERVVALEGMSTVTGGSVLGVKWSYLLNEVRDMHPEGDARAKEYEEECLAEKGKKERESVVLQELLERMYVEEIEKVIVEGKKGKEEVEGGGGKAVGTKAKEKVLLAPHLHSHSHLGELMDGEMSGGVDLGF